MRYNIEIVTQKLKEHGLILDNCNYINPTSKIYCHDSNGYKYVTTLDSILNQKMPLKYSVHNKYTIENIQHTLDIETNGVKILTDKYIDSKTKMLFQCTCGKQFYMNLSSMNGDHKRYCNFCSKSKRYDGIRDYLHIIQEKCKDLDYELITEKISRSSEKFDYICNKHKDKGVQSSTYDWMICQGMKCRYCGIESRGVKHRIPIETVKRLLEMKGFTYIDYEYVRRNGGSSKIKIHCYCNKHKEKGIQYLDYYNLKNNKRGCIYCVGRGRTQESLQAEFDELHTNITIINFNQYSDILVKCNKCKNEWQTSGVNILSGHRCPKCAKSNYEKTVENILQNNLIQYIPQYKFNNCKDKSHLPFDFYLTEYDVLIEVDGEGHFKPINFRGISDEDALESYLITKKHDKIKTDYCMAHNIKLIRIPYYMFNKKTKNKEVESFIISNI